MILSVFSFGAALSQPLVSVGVKGGVALTASSYGNNEGKRYLVGPSIELRLPAGFAVEGAAIYQRVGNTTLFFGEPNNPYFLLNRVRGNRWQFPILGKYYFQPRSKSWSPYLGTGYSFRTTWLESKGVSGPNGTVPIDQSYRSSMDIGAAAVAGVRFRKGRIAVSPEFRYTRWSTQSYLQERRNEVQFLLGISF